MATLPNNDDETPQTTVERVSRALAPVATPQRRTLALLTVAAGAGSLAPDPFGLLTAMACVIAASDLARKR